VSARPNSNMESTINWVLPWVMMVRLMVEVMALSMISTVFILRKRRKFSRSGRKSPPIH